MEEIKGEKEEGYSFEEIAREFGELGELERETIWAGLWGSRVYRTNSQESDFDYIFIVKDDYFERISQKNVIQGAREALFKEKECAIGTQNLRSNFRAKWTILEKQEKKLNVSIMGKTRFERMLNEHRIEALEMLFLSKQQILVEREKLGGNWKVDALLLQLSTEWEANRTWSKAKRKIKKGEMKKGKKELFHSLRYLFFSLQIIRKGKIENFEEANPVWFEMLRDCEEKDWSFYEKNYLCKFRELIHSLRKAVEYKSDRQLFYSRRENEESFLSHVLKHAPNFQQIKEMQEKLEKNSQKSKVETCNVISQFGLEKMRNFKVTVHQHPKYENLVCLKTKEGKCSSLKQLTELYERDEKIDGQLFEKVREECKRGIILDAYKNFGIVASSRFLSKRFGKNTPLKISNKFTHLREKVDGIQVILFLHKQEWILSSKCIQNSPFPFKV